MRINGWEPLTLDHRAADFVSFRHCGRGDKTSSVCQVISKDHVFKGFSDFTRGISL